MFLISEKPVNILNSAGVLLANDLFYAFFFIFTVKPITFFLIKIVSDFQCFQRFTDFCLLFKRLGSVTGYQFKYRNVENKIKNNVSTLAKYNFQIKLKLKELLKYIKRFNFRSQCLCVCWVAFIANNNFVLLDNVSCCCKRNIHFSICKLKRKKQKKTILF